jgi:hypothetical protein
MDGADFQLKFKERLLSWDGDARQCKYIDMPQRHAFKNGKAAL